MRKLWMAVLFWLGVIGIAQSQSFTGSPAIRTSGFWLELPSSVRAEGMAESDVAVAEGLGSMNVNPAGLGQMQDTQINLMHNSWVQDIFEEQLRVGFPLFGGFAEVGLGYLNGGNWGAIGVVSGVPVPIGTFQPNASRLDIGFGTEVIKDWYFGVSGTLANDSLVVDSQWGGIGNAGLLGKLGNNFRIGLSVVGVGGTAG